MSERSDTTGEHAADPTLAAELGRTLPAHGGAVVKPSEPAVDVPAKAGLERYKLLEEVGQGGMAVVWRAQDTALDREVAVKVLHPHLAGQQESRDRLEREAQAVAKLRHENILEIFDYSGRGSDKSFIVTEFIHGTTLRQFMTAHPLPHPELAELIVGEIARALEHAHKQGVIHRDIKPENVMIRADGVLKLMDFGIAQMIDKERMTVTGQLLGSPAYMAPEHVEGGGIDFRTDVFALGILLYQLATGELPFRGRNPHEVLKRIADGHYTPPEKMSPRVGRRLSATIARALAKDKSARFADVGEMRKELLVDLADAGIDDPRVEVTRLFADPPAYLASIGPRLVEALTQRGEALRDEGRRAAALELWRRALEIAPTSQPLLALVAGAERRSLGKKALVGTGVALVAIASVMAARPLWQRAPTLKEPETHAPPKPAPVVVTKSIAKVPAVKPVMAVRLRDRPHAIATAPEPVVAPKRHFELVPTPKAVRVLLDGQPLGDYGPQLEAVDLDGKPHTITFESPFCYPEHVTIEPSQESGRIVRRLKWRPATLTVNAQPESADIVIDGTLVTRSGRPLTLPIPPLSDGRRVLRVKVSAPDRPSAEREIELRANETKAVDVALGQGSSE